MLYGLSLPGTFYKLAVPKDFPGRDRLLYANDRPVDRHVPVRRAPRRPCLPTPKSVPLRFNHAIPRRAKRPLVHPYARRLTVG